MFNAWHRNRFLSIVSLINLQEENGILTQNNDDDDIGDGSNNNTGEIENVRVVVRIRPMDKNEVDAGSANVVKVDKVNRCVTVTKPNTDASEPPRIYYFDNVFGEDSSQVRHS